MVAAVQKRQTPPSTSYWAITKLTAPLWVANLAIVGGGTIDTLMVGQFGANDLAGVAVGIAITMSVFMGLVGVMQGLSPITGHHFGAGRFREIGYELHQSLWIGLVLSIIGIALISATPLWMKLTNSTGEVARIATFYLIISAIGLPGSMAGRAFIAINASVSRPKIAMIISLIMLALKAPLNYMFMYGLGPIPAFGGVGCALSSTFASWFTLLLFWGIWHFDPFYNQMRLDSFSRPDFKVIINQLKIGVPIGITSFFEITSFTFMTLFISRLGAVTVSGHQIVANMVGLLYMLPISIAIAGSVLVSQCLGADSPEEARQATFRSLKMGVFLAILVSIALYFYKEDIVSLYTPDKAVVAVAISLIGYACIFHVFDAMNCIGSFVLRGYKITVVPMVTYGVLLWVTGLGLGIVLCFTDFITPEPLGAAGFWIAIGIGLFLAGTIVAFLAIYVANATKAGKKTWLK